MTRDNTTRFAAMLAALSQPTRLSIVETVVQGGAEGTPAGQIAAAVHCPASTLSFHLKELSQAGLLHAAPQGRFIRYSVQPAAFLALAAYVAELPGGPPAPARGSRRGQPGKRTRGKGGKGGTDDGQLSIFGD